MLPQPPRDNTAKMANLWERMAGKEEGHVAKTRHVAEGRNFVKGADQTPSPNTVIPLPSPPETSIERTPSLGKAGRALSSARMPPRPVRANTRELINALERRCSTDVDASKPSDTAKPVTVAPPLARKLSSAEIDARAEQAIDAAAVADMTELKTLVERMTRRVSDLEQKIEQMQAALPGSAQAECHPAEADDIDDDAETSG